MPRFRSCSSATSAAGCVGYSSCSHGRFIIIHDLTKPRAQGEIFGPCSTRAVERATSEKLSLVSPACEIYQFAVTPFSSAPVLYVDHRRELGGVFNCRVEGDGPSGGE